MANKVQATFIDKAQEFNKPIDIYNRAANWALAGLDENKMYRLHRADQKRLLGFVVGGGMVWCDFSRQTAFNVVKSCFGTDWSYEKCYDLNTGEQK